MKDVRLVNYSGLGYVDSNNNDHTYDIGLLKSEVYNYTSDKRSTIGNDIQIGLDEIKEMVDIRIPNLKKVLKYFEVATDTDMVLVHPSILELDMDDMLNTNITTPLDMNMVFDLYKPLTYGTYLYNIDRAVRVNYVNLITELHNHILGTGIPLHPKDILYLTTDRWPEYLTAIRDGSNNPISYRKILNSSRRIVENLISDGHIRYINV